MMTLKMAVCIVNNNKQTKYEINEGKPTSKWPVFTNLIRVATKVHLTLCTVAVIYFFPCLTIGSFVIFWLGQQ